MQSAQPDPAAAALSPPLAQPPKLFSPLPLPWHPSMQMGELLSSAAASSSSGSGGALAAGVQPQQPPVSLPLGPLQLVAQFAQSGQSGQLLLSPSHLSLFPFRQGAAGGGGAMTVTVGGAAASGPLVRVASGLSPPSPPQQQADAQLGRFWQPDAHSATWSLWASSAALQQREAAAGGQLPLFAQRGPLYSSQSAPVGFSHRRQAAGSGCVAIGGSAHPTMVQQQLAQQQMPRLDWEQLQLQQLQQQIAAQLQQQIGQPAPFSQQQQQFQHAQQNVQTQDGLSFAAAAMFLAQQQQQLQFEQSGLQSAPFLGQHHAFGNNQQSGCQPVQQYHQQPQPQPLSAPPHTQQCAATFSSDWSLSAAGTAAGSSQASLQRRAHFSSSVMLLTLKHAQHSDDPRFADRVRLMREFHSSHLSLFEQRLVRSGRMDEVQSLAELSAAGMLWVPTPTVDEVANQFKAHGRVRRVICSFKVREDSDQSANKISCSAVVLSLCVTH